MQSKLVRSETDKMVAGVCGGIAAYLNVDSILVRFAFLMLIFASGIGIPLYLILIFLMPPESENTGGNYQADWEIEEEIKIYDDETTAVKGDELRPVGRPHPQGPIIFAIVLIAVGFYLLAQNMGFLGWLDIGWFGPLLIIGIGLYTIYRRRQ